MYNDRNYLSDSRVIAGERGTWYLTFDEANMVAVVCIYEDNGDETQVEVPVKYEVCPTCDGKGTHVNPAIDAGGITSSEWEEWDDEDRESYMSGAYDVRCYECQGKRVVPVLDRDRTDPKVVEAIDTQERALAECERESRAERMMGA
jgi:RecJ-like exonuclease